MKRGVLVLLGICLALFLYWWMKDKTKTEAAKPSAKSESGKPSIARPPHSKLSLANGYLRSEIEKRLIASRFQLSNCMSQAPGFAAGKIDFSAIWEGNGILRELDLSPDPGSQFMNASATSSESGISPPIPALGRLPFEASSSWVGRRRAKLSLKRNHESSLRKEYKIPVQ